MKKIDFDHAVGELEKAVQTPPEDVTDEQVALAKLVLPAMKGMAEGELSQEEVRNMIIDMRCDEGPHPGPGDNVHAVGLVVENKE